ncbi:MAG: RraA family protein [Candidatus Acidiferrales bacterium]
MHNSRPSPEHLEQLRRLSTCVVASAIETFQVRLPNAGFADSRVHCMFGDLPPVMGYAATARIRSANPPMEGRNYYARFDWWDHILTIPAPRIVVIEDVDSPAGLGAFVGEVHANILMALGCVALATNGAVRDLSHIENKGFQMFAGNVSVSHAYAHVFDFGGAVEIGGMKVNPGDLVHGDRHGIQTIPLEIAGEVPAVAQEILRQRQRLIGLCHAPDFTLSGFRKAVQEVDSYYTGSRQKEKEKD